jgi:hypothetical protein
MSRVVQGLCSTLLTLADGVCSLLLDGCGLCSSYSVGRQIVVDGDQVVEVEVDFLERASDNKLQLEDPESQSPPGVYRGNSLIPIACTRLHYEHNDILVCRTAQGWTPRAR